MRVRVDVWAQPLAFAKPLHACKRTRATKFAEFIAPRCRDLDCRYRYVLCHSLCTGSLYLYRYGCTWWDGYQARNQGKVTGTRRLHQTLAQVFNMTVATRWALHTASSRTLLVFKDKNVGCMELRADKKRLQAGRHPSTGNRQS